VFGSLALDYKPTLGTSVKPVYRYTGPRPDIAEQLPSYSLVDISGSYEVTDSFRAYINIYNVLDYEYEEISGYGTPGRWGLAGVQWTL